MKQLALVLMAILVVSACVGQTNPYQTDVGGNKMTFRSNLEKAKLVEFEDGVAAKRLLSDLSVDKIVIAYVPDKDYNGFYAVTGYEISYKLSAIEKMYYGGAVPVTAVTLNSTEEAYLYAGPSSPVIVMRAGAEKTAVTLDRNVIFVDGADMTENSRDYTDLDLAADRLLLELLKV